MAKSIQEWYDIIDAEKRSQNSLNGLQPSIDSSNTLLGDLTTSKVADHRLWMFISSVFAWMIDTLFDRHKAEIEQILSASAFGTLPWYRSAALEYQHGNILVYTNNRFQYQEPNLESKIIKYVSSASTFHSVTLKVATKTGGRPTPLTVDQLEAFRAYFRRVQPPGENVVIISIPSDHVVINLDIYYDPLLMGQDGLNILSGLNPVETAVNEYLNGVEFDGVFDLNELTTRLLSQKLNGIIKPYITSCMSRPDGSSIYTPIFNYATAASGSFALETLTVNYIPNV